MNKENKVQEIGVLMPALQYRYRFTITNVTNPELITRQTISVRINYVNETVTAILRQPAGHIELHNILMNCKKDVHLMIETLSGNGDVDSLLQFDTVMIKHDFLLTYESEDVAVHKLVFKIQ